MSIVSTLVLSAGYVSACGWALAHYALRFSWALLPEAVLFRDQSARQGALTPPRISATRYRSKGLQKPQKVLFGGTGV